MITGYLHPDYAASLAEFGAPRELPQCKGWILERQIPGSAKKDAMGCYPLFFCQDWTQLGNDLDKLGDNLVSLALVTDPFGTYSEADLQRSFDVVTPFKEHFVVDLSCPLNEIGSRRRRKFARRALRNIQIEVCNQPLLFLQEWLDLYNVLIDKHNIQGIRAFSQASFAGQLNLPGTVLLRAISDNTTIGAQLYFIQNDVVHCHLGAVNSIGYEIGATHALDWFSFEYFSHTARWLNLGSGAGVSNNGTDGLSDYKRGWSNETRTAYFCGRIFDHKSYSMLIESKGILATDYFPAYRKGEFG